MTEGVTEVLRAAEVEAWGEAEAEAQGVLRGEAEALGLELMLGWAVEVWLRRGEALLLRLLLALGVTLRVPTSCVGLSLFRPWPACPETSIRKRTMPKTTSGAVSQR